MTIPEHPPALLELRDALASNAVKWQEARKALRRFQGRRLWGSSHWKKLRQTLLANHCDQCGSAEPPLTLQHQRQPLPFSEILRYFRNEHRRSSWLAYKESHPIPKPTKLRRVCPHCGSLNIYYRKRLAPHWKCNSPHCGLVIDEPVSKTMPDRDAIATLNSERWTAFRQGYENSYERTNKEIGRQAVLAAIDCTLIYLSGEDTVTHCQKCAFMWDMKGLKLCPTCRKNWIEIWTATCNDCNPDFVTCSVCGQHRHHKRWSQCYKCYESADTALPD